jgi:hypothetical protein
MFYCDCAHHYVFTRSVLASASTHAVDQLLHKLDLPYSGCCGRPTLRIHCTHVPITVCSPLLFLFYPAERLLHKLDFLTVVAVATLNCTSSEHVSPTLCAHPYCS